MADGWITSGTAQCCESGTRAKGLKGTSMATKEMLRDIVGEGNSSTDSCALDSYASDLSFVRGMRPELVVRPQSTEDVVNLVRLAREAGKALVPVSSGAPHFHGDTVPATGGAVICDLSGMKSILLVNRQERLAICEAGVTFGELIPAVAKEGLRLNMPLHPRATKSVVGSLLSREPVLMPHYHWDISDPIGSTEVVFGTGDLFRTGAAAGPGTIEEQRAAGGVQKEAAGPSANSWHRILQGAQGTMGIVTWASIRCELLPTREEPYFIGSDDLAQLLQAAHWLVRLRLGNELLILDRTDLAGLVSENAADWLGLAEALPSWLLFFNLAAYEYLPDKRIQGQNQDVDELLQRLSLERVRSIGGVSAGQFLQLVRRPSNEPYWKLRPEGACQDIFFLTTHSKIPGLVKTMTELANTAGFPQTKIGTYIQPVVQGSSVHCEFSLFYEPTDALQTRAVRDLATRVIDPLVAGGAFFSRPFGEAARHIMNRDAATVETLKKVRAIVDPDSILNPGRLCF